MTTSKYRKAARVRNAILEYLNENGPQSMADTQAHLFRLGYDLSLQRVSQYLIRMEALGEVERRKLEAISPSTGKRCGAWVALVKRTVSAVVMGRHVAANANLKPSEYAQLAEAMESEKEKAKRRERKSAPGRIVHLSGDNPEIGRYPSGGQGALVRAAVGSGMYGLVW